MVLLESMWSPKKGSLRGRTEEGKEIGLGIPHAHSKTFYTRAIKERNMKEAWERDIKKSREELLSIARQDDKNYYDIPEEPYENTMYNIIFAYSTFEI